MGPNFVPSEQGGGLLLPDGSQQRNMWSMRVGHPELGQKDPDHPELPPMITFVLPALPRGTVEQLQLDTLAKATILAFGELTVLRQLVTAALTQMGLLQNATVKSAAAAVAEAEAAAKHAPPAPPPVVSVGNNDPSQVTLNPMPGKPVAQVKRPNSLADARARRDGKKPR